MLVSALSQDELQALESQLSEQYNALKASGLSLDLTRGKPGSEQLALSDALDGILEGNYKDSSGTDLRNYGGLDGLPEAKALFAAMAGVDTADMLIGGNSSLTLMHFCALVGDMFGFSGEKGWRDQGEISFLCPVPGYDRHFSICETFGIKMIPVAMDDNGPDMDKIEALVKDDSSIKGIWCVPRFSNPTGTVYSDDVVERFAKLGKIAAPDFRIFWDNAYCVHTLEDNAPNVKPLLQACREQGTEDSVLVFGSSSKVTFAGAGVAFVAASANNLATLKKQLGMATIGPDKVNQMRHVKLLKDLDGIHAHMAKHAAIIKPRFDAVLEALDSELGDSDFGSWTKPQGGYFISFDTQPGLAQQVVDLAAEAGVKLTPAGATFPYQKDPDNKNIRLAPTFPATEDVAKATEVFIVCVKLATVRKALTN